MKVESELGCEMMGEQKQRKRHGKKEPTDKVYLLSNPAFEGLYKIGITNNIKHRIKQLDTGVPAPFKLEVLFKAKGRKASRVEQMLHNFFNELRAVNGEFFELDDTNIIQLILWSMSVGCEIIQANTVWDDFLDDMSTMIRDREDSYQSELCEIRSAYGLDYDEDVPNELLTIDDPSPLTLDELQTWIDENYNCFVDEETITDILETQNYYFDGFGVIG